MTVCGYIKENGERCKAWPMKGEQWCYGHHPDYAQAREDHGRRGGNKAGRGRPAHSQIHEVKDQLRDLTDKVLAGVLDRADANTAGYLLGIWLKACEIERKVAEQDELAQRLEELEQVVNARSGRIRPWGS